MFKLSVWTFDMEKAESPRVKTSDLEVDLAMTTEQASAILKILVLDFLKITLNTSNILYSQ